MLSMRLNWISCVMLVLCVALDPRIHAADPAAVCGPLIDDQTLAVVRVDVQRIDLDAVMNRIQRAISELAGPEAVEQGKAVLESAREKAGARQEGFLQAGGRDLYAVVNTDDLPYFLVAIPVSAGNREAMLRQVQDSTKDLGIATLETYATGDLILVGRKEVIDRFKKRTPVRCDAVPAAFRACAGRTIQAVLIPTWDQNRVLAEMLPEALGGSGAHQFYGLRWAALGLDLPPSVGLGLTMEAPGLDRDSTEALLKLLKDVYAWVGQQSEVRAFVPDLDKVLAELTPDIRWARLVLNLDQAQVDSLIQRLVGPALLGIRENAKRTTCASRLSQIGTAILTYAGDHKDQLPADLQALSAAGKIPEGLLACPSVEAKESYAYRGAGLSTGLPTTLVLVHDKMANHKGEGRNVLFLDRHVEWVTESRFQDLIRKDNEARHKANLPELPAE